jgi:hypothetical protein
MLCQVVWLDRGLGLIGGCFCEAVWIDVQMRKPMKKQERIRNEKPYCHPCIVKLLSDRSEGRIEDKSHLSMEILLEKCKPYCHECFVKLFG